MQRFGFSTEGKPFAEFIRFLDDAADRGRCILRAIDVYETDRTVVVEVELPGWKKEQVSLQLVDNFLHLSGEPPSGDQAVEGRRYLRRERSTARIEETVRLPEGGVLVEDIQVTLNDGVLQVTVPKTGPREGRKVNID